ncbi:MAG: hypothetical protein IPG86_01790 [Chitinophagaceae bacterium]|nr:hypothetical protein [Chitinophagaceae bacterium]
MLQELIIKVQTNYAGYIHKVKESKDSSAYLRLKKKLRKEAAASSFKDCYWVLTTFVNYFNDGHLFVIELPRNSPQQSDSLRQFIKTESFTDEQLQQFRQQKITDPIEGIWSDKDQQLVIRKTAKNKYQALTIANTNKKWARGMVKMEIERTGPGEYFITIYRNDFAAIRFSKVKIYKNCLLPFGLYRFVREYPSHPESAYVHKNDPQMPFFRQLDDKTILLTVPTALIGKNILDSILYRHQKEILSTENLIIDIRGNLGGNAIWKNLASVVNTTAYPPLKNPAEDDFLLLASKDNADYFDGIASFFKQSGDSTGIAYYEKLKQTINQHAGTFIGFSFYDPKIDTAKRSIYAYPKKVALLTDKGTASAGEAFVLSMKANSTKVVQYGDNTWGMIDYMNINNRKIDCGENAVYYYGYPIFFSPTTKDSPINPTGIKPEVYVPAGTPDWVEWVRKHMSK